MVHETQKIIDLSGYPKRHNAKAASPFRYPGGKGFLTPYLEERIAARLRSDEAMYAEAYCGGAGSALNLLIEGNVSHIFLNDADYRIYSAWNAIVNETDRFIEALSQVEVDMQTWEQSIQKLHEKQNAEYSFEVGFATFFINRTSRSGVIMGSGPIGGYNQEGKWKIDARFNKEGLSKKIRDIGKMRDKVSLTCLDGIDFCKSLAQANHLEKTFLFVDPPYVEAGGRLYHNGMNLAKHDALAEWLRSGAAPHWLLTYDDHPLVRENYSGIPQYRIQVQYSLGRARLEKELLFMSE